MNEITDINCDVFDSNANCTGIKTFGGDSIQSINKWLLNFYRQHGDKIGILSTRGNDFQNQKYIYLAVDINNQVHDTKVNLSYFNLIPICVYFSVRQCIEATWLNDRDQFLCPNDKWEDDDEFQNDCLALTLFHGQNRITIKEGTNHWIPFTEKEVNSRDKFESSFMTDLIAGKLKKDKSEGLFDAKHDRTAPLEFSDEAKAVFDAGRELWKYYHKQPKCNVNASLYDIREFFQGRDDKGKMKNKSDDTVYMKLIGDLRDKLKLLAKKIEPKVYEYGFLRK